MTTDRHRRQGRRPAALPVSLHFADGRRACSGPGRIIDTLRQALIVLDEKLCVISANCAFYHAFALVPEETVGLHLVEVGDHRLDVPALRSFLNLCGTADAAIEDYEMEIELPALGSRMLLLNAQKIREDPEANCEIVVTIDDVTERRRVETALKAAKWHAERANLSKSRFLAAASHDLRQRLQTLSLMREILAKKIKDNKDEEALQLVTHISETAGALSGELETLTDINQLEAGIVHPEKVNFPINNLLEQLRIEFADHAQAHGLLWHVAPCRLSAWSDPRLLAQMFRNLLSNVLKNMERGKILLGCRQHGDRLRIEVWHTGGGISEGQLQAIFGNSHQIDNAGCECGLGLAIARRLGDLLGHALIARSRPDSGSVYAIEVPRTKPVRATELTHLAQSLLTEPRQPPVQAGSPLRAQSRGDILQPTIFVVDDEVSVREAMRGLLQEEGWLVEVYPSAEAFLEADHPGRLGCLVVDARMPRMGGVELLERLKTEDGGLPAIMITGHGNIRLAVRAMKAGAMAFLEKPVQFDELIVNIERALELTRNSVALSSLRKEAARRIAEMTPRERQVVEMVVEGNPNKQIAYVLGISQRTVETHRATAMKKIGARTISELIHMTISAARHDVGLK